ncbi:MAG: SPOR domain-containing protein, partial [Gammaproteobacteria bacterium]
MNRKPLSGRLLPAALLILLASMALPQAKATAAAGGDHPYAVQLKLSRQRPSLEGLPSLPALLEYRLYTNSVTLKGKQWYQLRLGFFATTAEARQVNESLQQAFPGSWIVKTSPQERKAAARHALGTANTAQNPAPRTGAATKDTTATMGKAAQLMEEARRAMAQASYSRAVALYTKILQLPGHPYQQDAQEFLGVARERKGQLAHAKAEYEKYLRLYPKGEGAERVRQRLAGILTARAKPQSRIKKRAKTGRKEGTWLVFGGFSQYYRRDVSYVDRGGDSVDQSSLISDLDVSGRYRDGRYDVRTRFSGGYDYDFLDAGDNDTRISSLYAEARDQRLQLRGRLGRQTLSSGGVLGRFDGLWLNYPLMPELRVNFVSGYPVEKSTDAHVDTERHFYGLNFDLGTFNDSWDFNVFYIKQLLEDITDREAVGGEARYFHGDRSLLALLDYDVEYGSFNIAQLVGNMTLPAQRVTLNLLLEYRRSPLLTTSNALIGQDSDTIDGLRQLFSSGQIQGLAEDRTADYTTLSLGAARPVNQHFQLSGEFTVTHLSDLPASGGVDAVEGSGYEYFYDLQLIGSDLLKRGDLTILGARFSDTANAYVSNLSLDTRFPLHALLRINPRLLFDYRSFKDSNGDQWTFSPLVRVDYQWRRRRHFELDAGAEWSSRNLASNTENSSA